MSGYSKEYITYKKIIATRCKNVMTNLGHYTEEKKNQRNVSDSNREHSEFWLKEKSKSLPNSVRQYLHNNKA